MFPNKRQFKNWSLPTKWSFWTGIIGITIAIISLTLSFTSFPMDRNVEVERNQLLLRVAQELRYNHEWLSEVAISIQNKSEEIPIGHLKTEALLSLIYKNYHLVTKDAYGEEKYIYQEALKLAALGEALGKPITQDELRNFNKISRYKANDLHFLNNFLFWYLRPLFESELDKNDIYSLGWNDLPNNELKIKHIKKLEMSYFQDGGKPIATFDEYLGLID